MRRFWQLLDRVTQSIHTPIPSKPKSFTNECHLRKFSMNHSIQFYSYFLSSVEQWKCKENDWRSLRPNRCFVKYDTAISMIQWNIFIPRAQHCVRLSFDRAHIRKCGNHTQNNKVTARAAHKMSENRVCMFAFHSCDREWQWKLDEYVRVRITSCSSFVDCSMLYVERNH